MSFFQQGGVVWVRGSRAVCNRSFLPLVFQRVGSYLQQLLVSGDLNRRPDRGESFLVIKNRFLPFIETLTQDASLANAHILLVGHGGLFKLMLPLILTNIEDPFVPAQGISHTDCIITEPQPDGFKCLQWGKIHLG
jgi:broad specificity phosphatase PhoE